MKYFLFEICKFLTILNYFFCGEPVVFQCCVIEKINKENCKEFLTTCQFRSKHINSKTAVNTEIICLLLDNVAVRE